MQVRPATMADAEAIRQIYNREVRSTTATFDLVERSHEDQVGWLTDRAGAHAVLVATEKNSVVGFGALSPYRERPAYRTTVEDSVYVGDGQRGRGVGSALLEELIATAARHGFHTIVARISGNHDASIALHQRCGFEHVGTEKEVGRKFGRWLDVVVMQLMIR